MPLSSLYWQSIFVDAAMFIFCLFLALQIILPVVVSFIRDRDREGIGIHFLVAAGLEEEETSSGRCRCRYEDDDDGQALASASAGSFSDFAATNNGS